ncbi:Uncharacterised protein [Serratia ficaria]|nr:Uncharacterised protein [Serratia ficaria]CAI1768978.1 Uncharacterised protein [Serratia ficaria]CAI2464590.1 Uncharacterised protein [Serratia ficaria]
MKSGVTYRLTSVLCSVSLMMLLTGCAKTQTEYEAVKVESLPIPASLLTDCRVPDVPEGITYADSVVLNASMQKALEDCSNEKAAIRKIEAERSK